MSILETVRTFPPAPESVPEARGFTRAALSDWGVGDVDDALVVVSELVANAIMHAGTPTTVELRLEGGRLRLGVEDQHPSKLLRMGADLGDTDEVHGRGLVITSALTIAWGVEYRATSKRVWAELALQVDHVPVGVDGLGGSLVEASADVVAGVRHAPQEPLDMDPLGLRASALNRLAIDDLMRLVLERARDRGHADAAYLLMSQGIEDQYVVQAVSGLPDGLRHRIVRPGETGAPGRWSQLAPVVIDDLARDPAPLLDGLPLRSLVVAQIVFEGRVVGALALASERTRSFTEDDGATLQLIADWVAGAVERARLRAAERERRAWLSFLSDTGELLSESLELDMTVAMIGQIAVPRLATWCGIYLADERGEPALEHAWHADERRLDELGAALRGTTPADVADVGDPALTGAITTLTLGARGRVAGWLVVGRESGGPLKGEVKTVAEAFATRAALAIDNARVHAELRTISQTLQRSLLPDSVPSIPGVGVGVGYQATGTTAVGGDFYDVFPHGGGRWCFVVGDVCGKGADGAAVTGIARHTIRAMMRSGFGIGTTLERLNDAILEEGERGRFLTLVCGSVQAGGRSSYDVRLVCAGHPSPFVERAGEVTRIGRSQPLLGVLDHVDYEEEHLRLSAGSRLVMVTDGVLERRAGDRMFDDLGVESELRATTSLTAQGFAERILRAVAEFAAEPPADDVAVLALDLGARVTMSTSSSRAEQATAVPPPRVGAC